MWTPTKWRLKLLRVMATRQLPKWAVLCFLEPIMTVEVVTPEENMGDVVGDLNRRRGLIRVWTIAPPVNI